MSNCCFDKCCVDSLDPIMFGERAPVFLEMGDWLDSVYSQGVDPSGTSICINPAANTSTGETPDDLMACNVNYDHVTKILSFNIYGGTAGAGYQVTVAVKTCEGHIGKYCFKQYIKAC